MFPVLPPVVEIKISPCAYYRVSTSQQGQSGLGLEAQHSDVHRFLEGNSWSLMAREFVEVEKRGKSTNRLQLQEALATCRLYRATLVIAKLDRLSRSAAFLLSLRDAGIEFIACDMPYANRLTIGIMALIAEDEAERIRAAPHKRRLSHCSKGQGHSARWL